MKRKTTKEILVESFRELAEKKPADKITVQEIAANCGYSPATFYRHFRDKYDLIAWEYVSYGMEIMDRIDAEGYEWRQTPYDAAEYYWENRAYLKNLFQHTSGHESFVRYVAATNIKNLRRIILHRTGEPLLSNETEIMVRIYCYGTVEMACEWILGGVQAPPDTMGRLFEDSLPAPLRKYLY